MKLIFQPMKRKINLIPIILLFFVTFSTCKKENPLPPDNDKPDSFNPTPYTLDLPFYFPTVLNIPPDNPMTIEGIELGRYLFYDGRLSGRTHPDSLMTCATCHLQEYGFSTGINHPKFTGGRPFGLTGIQTPHYTMPLVNLVFNSNGYLWNGMIHESNDFLYENNPLYHRRNIESLVWMGIVAPHEMYGNVDQTVQLIASIPMYAEKFEAAFGTPEVTYERISKAIAQFVRSLVSFDSKFDKYLRGEVQLTTQELQGFVLFTTESGADCFHCHGASQNPLWTTNLFYNNAKDSIFNDPRDRFAFTGDVMDKGAYKSPTLRNIELTGPYMHDGRFSTLEEVIDFYSEGLVFSPYANPLMHKLPDNGAQLTPNQKQALLSFLKTLTDESFTTNPAFSKPADL
ncbi:MAG: cytochrome c peroxidase [Bacteroidales bacterium]|nr:cytochrome c peroxidase [Bacteroidales bacterium]